MAQPVHHPLASVLLLPALGMDGRLATADPLLSSTPLSPTWGPWPWLPCSWTRSLPALRLCTRALQSLAGVPFVATSQCVPASCPGTLPVGAALLPPMLICAGSVHVTGLLDDTPLTNAAAERDGDVPEVE